MNLREHLIILIEAYATAKRISTSRVSSILFSSGTKYDQLVSGADITVGRLEDAVTWFSANWPEDAPWPDGIARPSKPEAAA